jgi:hypothetical protein
MKREPLVRHTKPFSWSLARHNLFEYCQRAYFYRYYGASGGWDRFSDGSRRKLYILKNLKKAEHWLEEVLRESLREVFISGRGYQPPDIVEKHIFFLVQKKFNRGWLEVRGEKWREDPKFLNIHEAYYKNSEYEFFSSYDNLKDRLMLALDTFRKSVVFKEMLAVDSLSWKFLRYPVKFTFLGYDIWTSPAIVWSSGGFTNILDFRMAGNRDDSPSTRHAIFTFMANARFKVAPGRIRSRTVFLGAGANAGTVSEKSSGHEDLRQFILESVFRMKEKLSRDNMYYETDFSKRAADAAKCPGCEYSEFCEDRYF